MKIRVGLWALMFLMLIQAVVSLVFPVYQDSGWVRDTWFGNDLVTLLLVCPVLLYALTTRKKSGKSLALGILGYAIYNYSYYLLGAAINKLFVFYAATIVLSAITLIGVLLEKNEFTEALDSTDLYKGYAIPAALYIFIAVGLGIVWIANWANYAFAGKDLPQSPEVFRLVASLDIVLMIAPLVAAALFLLKKHRYGLRIGVIIGIQAFLYLIILSLNSTLISVKAGNFPGELPVWGTLIVIEGVAIGMLLVKLYRQG